MDHWVWSALTLVETASTTLWRTQDLHIRVVILVFVTTPTLLMSALCSILFAREQLSRLDWAETLKESLRARKIWITLYTYVNCSLLNVFYWNCAFSPNWQIRFYLEHFREKNRNCHFFGSKAKMYTLKNVLSRTIEVLWNFFAPLKSEWTLRIFLCSVTYFDYKV